MESKQKICECAKILFFENGFKSVTKKMVADLSGCNQGLINYYYKELGNIASLISSERYKIISACVKTYVDIRKDPFSFEYTLKYYLHMINTHYETAARFEKEAFKEINFGHAACDYDFREDSLAQLGYRKNQDLYDIKADRHYELISAFRLGMKGSYLSRIASGVEIPFDEYIHSESGRCFNVLFRFSFSDTFQFERFCVLHEKSEPPCWLVQL